MKKTLLVLSLLLLGFSKSFAQETAVQADGPVRLIRSGLSFYHQGPHAQADLFWDHSFSLLLPSYTHLSRRMYFSCPLPTLSINSRNGAKISYCLLQPALGVVFLRSEARFRPFVAGVLNLEVQKQSFTSIYSSGSGRDVDEWATRTSLELRLGAYYRITNRVWVDLTVDAPTGHSLYYLSTSSGDDARQEVFNNSYDTYLPKVQLGVSYQIR